jgi:hypothetical protein
LFPVFGVLFLSFGFPFAFIPFLPLGKLDISLPVELLRRLKLTGAPLLSVMLEEWV